MGKAVSCDSETFSSFICALHAGNECSQECDAIAYYNSSSKKHPIEIFGLLTSTDSSRWGEANGLISKFNERRATGILAQPRVGRTTGMSSFTRLDGVAGLVHYPRVGRSGSFSPSISFHQDTPFELEANPGFLNHGEVDIASLINLEYQNHPYNNNHGQKQVNHQQLGISTKNRRWIEESRYGTIRSDQQRSRLHHCSDRSIEEARALLFAPSEGRQFQCDPIKLDLCD